MSLSWEQEKKIWLRKQSTVKAICLDEVYKQEASAVISSLVIDSEAFRDASSIFIYVSTEREPDTYGLIEEALERGKAVYVPKCLKKRIMLPVRISSLDDLEPGVLGIMEPKKELWERALEEGLAQGYGSCAQKPGGQVQDPEKAGSGISADEKAALSAAAIDLAVVPCVCAAKDGRRLGHGAGYYDIFFSANEMPKMCLCFEELISNSIPSEEHDVLMDHIVTEEGINSRP